MTRKKKINGFSFMEYGGMYRMVREDDDSMYPFPHGEMRTKQDYPYSYDPFFTYGDRETMEGCQTVYSDRLSQWDYEKNRTAIANNFSKDRTFLGQSPRAYQAYLSEYYGRKVKLGAVAEGCNVANGYPYLIFFFKFVETDLTSEKKSD